LRLIACSNCHTQYDVTDVALERIPCRCGAEIENRDLQAMDAKILRCGSCGAIVDAVAEGCDYCGSAIERDPGRLSLICPECFARSAEAARFCTACGVAFRPEQVRIEGQELPCPDCGALMPPHQVGDVGINECRSCNGLWVPGEGFDRLLSRAVETCQNAGPAQRLARPPRVTGANPAAQGVKYRKCPECMSYMQRRNYRKSSGVIIDVCHQHGTWLDADELEQIAGFILSGRSTSPALIEEEQKAAREAARLRREAARAGYPTRHPLSQPSTGSTLLGFFLELLD